MSSASLALIAASVGLTFMGLPCCLGWLNWFAIPASFACIVIGAVGLASDKDQEGRPRDPQIHLTAVIVGASMAVIGAMRWLFGGGLI
jgi:hypothetical protein